MLWLILCLSGKVTCSAQITTGSTQNWQIDLSQQYDRQRKQTLQLIRKHKWPVRKNYSRSKQLVLQETDPLGSPIYYTLHNTEAARGTRTQALYKGGSLKLELSGSSTTLTGKIGLWDGGRALATHQELAGSTAGGPVVQQMDRADNLSDHTTHLAGTVVARGINPLARGMAYGARLSIWDYTDDLSEITAAAPDLLLSNHAYGPVVGWVYNPSRPGTDPNLKWEWWGNPAMSNTEDYLFGFYTTKARDLDRIAYNSPFYLMVRSADNKRAETGPPSGTVYFLKNTNDKSSLPRSRNDTYDVIPAEATAKNVLTVGAADVTFNNQNQPVTVGSTSFSGWGPTDDGRIKPDLLGIGTDVFSTLTSNASAYGMYTGTSMASANVTGSLALLQELYAQQKEKARGAGGASNGLVAQGTGQFMRSATVRGLVLHTANRNTPAAGPDYRQGWGLLDTEAAARVILNTDQAHYILEKTLESGGTFTQRIVAQGDEPLIVTLCWTDPEGVATTFAPASVNSLTPKLVNDLDVRLNDGRTTTLPFVLDPGNPSRPATSGDNIRDNIEQIYIQNPSPGQAYSLSVSHKGNMTYAGQPFSIIISGLRRSPCSFAVTISPRVDTTLCTGESVLLSSEARSGFTFQWLLNNTAIDNAVNTTYRASQAGSYALRVTDASGCSATSPSVNIQLKTPKAILKPATDQWLCSNGQPLQLTAMDIADSQLEWLRNGTVLPNAQSATLNIAEPGRYQVRISQQRCKALSDTVVVRQSTVNTIALKPDESDLILLKGATVILYAPAETDYRYQWYRDNTILTNANDDRLSVSEQGVYKVRITQQTCVGWSAERTVHLPVLTSVSPRSDSSFAAYPNPVEQTLDVQYAYPNANDVQVSVFDMQGRIRQSPIRLKSINQLFQGTLNLSNLSAGIYYLRLSDGDRTRIWRFLKK
jgi:hypothetical protein